MKRINVTSCNHNNSTGATLTDQWSRTRANRSALAIITTEVHTTTTTTKICGRCWAKKNASNCHATLTTQRWNCVNTKKYSVRNRIRFIRFIRLLAGSEHTAHSLHRAASPSIQYSRLTDQRSPRKQRAHTLSRSRALVKEFDVRSRSRWNISRKMK